MNTVQLKYNGEIFSDKVITDGLTSRTPCPTVSITTNANRDIDNTLLYETNTITLDGIIISSGNTADLVQSYSGVVKFFSAQDKQNGLFEIVCGTENNGQFTGSPNGFIKYSGVNFVSATADKSSNNWYMTIPYTIVLESVSNDQDPDKILIESYDDSWNIEVLEDVSYFSTRATEIPNYTHNIAGEPVDGDPGPNGLRKNTAPSSQLLSVGQPLSHNVENHVQYRITHRVSAVGKTRKEVDSNNPRSGNGVNTNNKQVDAYENAAKWVYRRLWDNILDTAPSDFQSITGVVINRKTPVPGIDLAFQQRASNQGLFLYNHIRTIESSPSAGSYGVVDTWLALGTGVKYTEDFTWEISTDDKWIHTVTINGTIKGLELTDKTIEADVNSEKGIVVMPAVKTGGGTAASYSPALTGVIKGSTDNASLGNSLIVSKFANQKPESCKYNNALQAYISGVKPFLYIRANHALQYAKIPVIDDNQATTFASYGPYKRTWFGPYTRPLNIVPVSFNETFSPVAGQITYTISYNDRPASLLSGAIDASVSITDTNSTDIITEAFVLGRPLGPVLEKVGSSKSERQLTIEALYPVPTAYNALHPQSPRCVIYHRSNPNDSSTEYKAINDLVNAFKPVGATAFSTLGSSSVNYLSQVGQVFKTLDNETWNPFEGRYTRNVTWVYNTGTCR